MANDYSTSHGMVSVWRHEDATGAARADALSQNTLLAGAGPSRSTDEMEGTYSGNYVAASSHYSYLSDAALSSDFPFKSGTTNLSFTVACWFKLTSHTVGNGTLWQKWDSSGNQRGFMVQYVASDNELKGYVSDGTAFETLQCQRAVVTGLWYHVILAYDHTTGTFHFSVRRENDNAMLAASEIVTAGVTGAVNTAGFYLGAYNGATNYLDGRLDEVIIFNRCIQTWEMEDLFRQVYTGPDHNGNVYSTALGMVAVYPMGLNSWPNSVPLSDAMGYNLNDMDSPRSENRLATGGAGGGPEPSSIKKVDSLAAGFAAGDSEFGERTDGALTSDYPFKSGTSNLDLTISLWFRLTSHPANNMGIFGKFDAGAANKKAFLIYYNSTGNNVRFQIGTGAASNELAHATSLSTNTWYHITCTYDNTTKVMNLYLRGSANQVIGQDKTSTIGGAAVSAGDVNIGCYQSAGARVNFFNGMIDEVIVFNRAITAEEAELLTYQAYKEIPVAPTDTNDFTGDTNLMGMWNLNATSFPNWPTLGDNAIDDSGKGNHLPAIATTGLGPSRGALLKEGAYSGNFYTGNDECYSLLSSSLSADFPFITGGGSVVSICAWVWLKDLSALYGLVTKWRGGGDFRSFNLLFNNANNHIEFYVGTNSGVDNEGFSFATAVVAERWYHVGVTLDGSKNVTIRIWDDTAGAIHGTDFSGSVTGTPAPTNARFELGSYWDNAAARNYFLNGFLDEVIVMDRAITTDEIDAIRSGAYVPPSSEQTMSRGIFQRMVPTNDFAGPGSGGFVIPLIRRGEG